MRISDWSSDVCSSDLLESRSIVWAISGSWVRQHDAEVLRNGNILLFDNEGSPSGPGVSRVLEFDPATYEVTWSYGGRPGQPLDSVMRSSQNRQIGRASCRERVCQYV